MEIKPGDKVINFNKIDYMENNIVLSNYNNKKVLLSFYRYASCPLCNLRIHQLIKNFSRYRERGLVILAFFESPVDSIKKYVGLQEPPFSLIPDPERVIYKKYNVKGSITKYIKGLLNGKLFQAARLGYLPGKMENEKTLVPADFLIEDGIIKEVYYGKDISDHIPIEIIERFLE